MSIAATGAPGLAVADLCKSYAGRRVVDRVAFEVARGELFALLGPNGAGKTTTLRMIAGLLQADAGEARIAGASIIDDPLRAKAHLAYVPDDPPVYDKLTPREYLEFIAALWSVPGAVATERATRLITALGLLEVRDDRTDTLSRGMRQKLALAGALLHAPDVLLLDEPFTGLDAASARVAKDMLRAELARGASIVLTTHILDMAERFADRIGIVARGRIVAMGTLADLRTRAAEAADGGGTLEDVFLALTRDVPG